MNHQQIRIVLSVLLLLGLLSALPDWAFYAPSAQAQKQQLTAQLRRYTASQEPGQTADALPSEGFILVRGEHGARCRAMTAQEEQAFALAERSVALHALSEEPTTQLQQQTGLKITFRTTAQLENFPQAKAAFQRAEARLEALIQSDITIIVDVDFGTTLFGTPYPNPNIIGATGPQRLRGDNLYASLRAALLNAASSSAQRDVYLALPPSSLPTELGSTTNFSAPSANLRAIGLINPVANPSQEPNFGSPPAIGFNSAFPFDFDPSDGIDPDKLDFEGTAVHEILHALGFITDMGSRELDLGGGALSVTALLSPTPWDFFRFRPGGLEFSSLGNGLRALLSGGEQVFFPGVEEKPLSTGTVQGNGGDQNQGSHWKDDFFTGQYIGVMDPSGSFGDRDELSAADLVALNIFGYRINPAAEVHELLTVSDNTREETQTRTNALVVNRYTPPRYPATLKSFRVFLPAPLDGTSPVGQPLRIVAFADPNRTGQPPANPALLVDRTLNIPALPGSRILDVQIPNGPVINGGDLYVGIQTSSTAVTIAADLNGRQQNRSFISTNNGQSFQTLTTVIAPTPVPVNFIARAFMSMPFANATAPGALTLSPSAVAPGGAAFTLNVFGSGFQQNSVVRVNNSDRQTTFLSGSLLRAQIPATDVAAAGTAKITVFNPAPGGGETLAVDLAITGNNPAPTLTRLNPPGGAAGAGNLTLNVFGTNFNAQSRVRVNGNERQTTLVNSTQLTTTLTPADLAGVASLSISVATPAPGGGASNALTFGVVTCAFTTTVGSTPQIFASTTSAAGVVFASGFVLSASSSVCPWTATASEPWITVVSANNGFGRSIITYTLPSQPEAGTLPRDATLSVGNQMVNIRQRGRASVVSSASFTTALASESISAIFGAGLAKETRNADSTPLPTTLGGATVSVQDSLGVRRNSPLFFVSPGQNNFQIPPGTATGNGFVIVAIDGREHADSRMAITNSAPGFFAANANGQGVAAAVLLRVKADSSQSFENVIEFNSTTNRFVAKPIDFGPETDRLFLLLFGTGIRGRASLNNVALQIGGTAIPAQFAGAHPSLIGLDQVNLELPRSLAGRGEVNITGTVDGRFVNVVTVAFR